MSSLQGVPSSNSSNYTQETNELIKQAEETMNSSFGILKGVGVGYKITSQSSGTPGEKNFKVTIHQDYVSHGVTRTVWNVFAGSVNRWKAPENQMTVGEIGTNTKDISKAILHLATTFEKMDSLLLKMSEEEREQVMGHIVQLQNGVVGSREGIHNLLITYIMDRMPNTNKLKEYAEEYVKKNPPPNLQARDELKQREIIKIEVAKRVQEMKKEIAVAFAHVLIKLDDKEFEDFKSWQSSMTRSLVGWAAKKAGYDSNAAMSYVGKLLNQQQLTSIDEFFPTKDKNMDELREIGKLLNHIDEFKNLKATFVEAFKDPARVYMGPTPPQPQQPVASQPAPAPAPAQTQPKIEAMPPRAAEPLPSNQPAGAVLGPDQKIWFANGSHWEPKDGKYYFRGIPQNEPFTDAQINALQKNTYRFRKES